MSRCRRHTPLLPCSLPCTACCCCCCCCCCCFAAAALLFPLPPPFAITHMPSTPNLQYHKFKHSNIQNNSYDYQLSVPVLDAGGASLEDVARWQGVELMRCRCGAAACRGLI